MTAYPLRPLRRPVRREFHPVAQFALELLAVALVAVLIGAGLALAF